MHSPRPAIVISVVTFAAGLLSIATAATAFGAAAHQPVFIDDTTSVEQAPVLDDGTTSFAVYGTLTSPERSATVRVGFAQGDTLSLQLLVPDQAPERQRDPAAQPLVTVVTPSGATTTYLADQAAPFHEPASNTDYLILAEATQPAEPGITVLTVTGPRASRFVLTVGTREVPGTVSTVVPPPTQTLADWYATPPPPGPDDQVGGDAPTDLAAGDLDPSRLARPPVADSTPGRATGLPLAVAMVIILVVVLVLVWRSARQRRGRRPPAQPAPDQFVDGSGGQ